MGLVVYPPRPREPGPAPFGSSNPSQEVPASAAQDSRDRLVVGLLAGAVLFYLLGKAVGLGRDNIED